MEFVGFGFLPLGKICPCPLWTDKLNILLNNTQKINTFLPRGSPGVPQRVSWGAPRWRGDVDGRGEVDGAARSTARRGRWRGEVDGATRSMARRGRRRGEVDGAARSMTRRGRRRGEVDGAARSTARRRRGRWRGEVDCAAMSMARLGRWLGDVDGIAISIIIVIVIVIITARTAKLVPRGSKMATQRLKNQPWRHQDSPK